MRTGSLFEIYQIKSRAEAVFLPNASLVHYRAKVAEKKQILTSILQKKKKKN